MSSYLWTGEVIAVVGARGWDRSASGCPAGRASPFGPRPHPPRPRPPPPPSKSVLPALSFRTAPPCQLPIAATWTTTTMTGIELLSHHWRCTRLLARRGADVVGPVSRVLSLLMMMAALGMSR